MYIRSDERRPQLNTGLALRVAIMGGIGLVLFAVIFFRLWFLQVLSGDKYLAEANNNRTREVRVPAPRGEILDRSGGVLVDNRTSLALQVNPQKLPTDPGERRRELARLGQLTHSSLRKIRRTLREGIKVSGTAPVTLRQDVGHTLVYYLQENRTEFPGVEIASVYIRRYPKATLAAHLVGSVGEIDSKELKEPRYRGLKPGDVIGKGGVEYSYDRYLRGLPGLIKNQVDSLGVPDPGRADQQHAAAARRQPEAVDRPDGAGRRRGGTGRQGPSGGLRDDERAQRPDPRHGLLPDLRPDRIHPPDDPEPGERAVP